MSQPTVTLVTDSNCNFQAIYYDGKLVADLSDDFSSSSYVGRWNLDDVLGELCDKMGVPYESVGGWQLGREIRGFDWTDYDSYWPENLADVPPDERTYEPEDDVRTDGDDTDTTG